MDNSNEFSKKATSNSTESSESLLTPEEISRKILEIRMDKVCFVKQSKESYKLNSEIRERKINDLIEYYYRYYSQRNIRFNPNLFK